MRIAFMFVLLGMSAQAHNGFVGKNGCHINNAKSIYECHKGPLAGKTFTSKKDADEAMKKLDNTFVPSKGK